MEAFKESGAIEYSTDVLIGLQFSGIGEEREKFNLNEEKKQNPRKIQAVLLKNRAGKSGMTIDFDYYPEYNFFIEK
jgi:replicative DNA helicase